MNYQSIGVIVAIIVGILSSCTMLIAIPIFMYRRGQADRELVLSLKAITTANENLSAEFHAYKERTNDTLHTHDLRIRPIGTLQQRERQPPQVIKSTL